MSKLINIIGIVMFFILGLFSFGFSQESMTITTYYPSPYGSYNELTAYKMKVGTTYSGSGTYVADNNLIVEGSVGIGTTGPGAYRLYVNGNMYVNGDITTDSATYADYVFESGYTLMSLRELGSFITQNKHLPNMPSSEKVKEEGVKLFEQNRLMLEKLEEAYLYIIQLEERIVKLENALSHKDK